MTGHRKTPERNSWESMMARCTKPANDSYPRYGGRGIKVCERWQTFEGFCADMAPRPPGTSLDRIDNDGHYEPGNCRWATPLEQNANRGGLRLFEFHGETIHRTELSRRTGVPTTTLRKRLARGLSLENAITPAAPRPRKAPREPRGTLTHCKRGHEFTPENTRVRHRLRVGDSGRPYQSIDRECRTCARIRKAGAEA